MYFNFDLCRVVVRRSRYAKHITNTKSKKPRGFTLTPDLVTLLRGMAEGRERNEPMFLSKKGKRLHPDNFVARVLKPVTKKLALKGGLHAFRHGNATAQDDMMIPMATRQGRLGHENTPTTMGYTHQVDESAQQVPKQLSKYFALDKHFKRAASAILMPKDAKSKNENLAAESQGFSIQ